MLAAAAVLWIAKPMPVDAAGLPARPPAAALLPGAGTVLGIAQLAEAGPALERPFDDPVEVTLAPGSDVADQTPPHCRALLAVEDRITGTRPASDWNVLQQRLADCRALEGLTHAAAPSRTALPNHMQAARKTRLWPASAWPAISQDETKALARPGQTLQSASGRRSWLKIPSDKTGLVELRLDSDVYTVRVQWLARGDFDGDGWEDWLLRWQAHAAGGTWHAARSLLLSRRAAGDIFSLHVLGRSL